MPDEKEKAIEATEKVKQPDHPYWRLRKIFQNSTSKQLLVLHAAHARIKCD